MTYNDEDRMIKHQVGGDVVTYTYAGVGLMRPEESADGLTAIVWDGSDNLQQRT